MDKALSVPVSHKICTDLDLSTFHLQLLERQAYGKQNSNQILKELFEKIKNCFADNESDLLREYLEVFFNGNAALVAGCCTAFDEAKNQVVSPGKKRKTAESTGKKVLLPVERLAFNRLGPTNLVYFSPENGELCKAASKKADISRTSGQTLNSAVFAQDAHAGSPSNIFKLICSELAAGRLQIGGKFLEEILLPTE